MTSASRSLSRMLRKLTLILAFAGFSAGGLTACNTVQGAGQDIESTGEAIEDSAD